MSHLVKPAAFRLGKTLPWKHNTLLSTKKETISGNLTFGAGVIEVSKHILRRKRLYVVCGNVGGFIQGSIIYNLIFMPRVKTKPREMSVGMFMRKSIYKPVNLLTKNNVVKNYVHSRKDKIAKIRRKYRVKRLNKWLSKRMFRGAARVIWKKSKTFTLARYVPPRDLNNDLVANITQQLSHAVSNPAPVVTALSKIHKSRAYFTNRRIRWRQDSVRARRFNDRKYSQNISRLLNRSVKIKSENLFAYLIKKNVVDYKSHQNHFWNFRYRRYRFHYKNYYDITNAFFALGTVDNSEMFLLSILKITLPLIIKIRKFFKFLNTVIKNMPELEDKFSVLKINIAGKLAGGTKRTKFHSIGYGTLPVQTLSIQATNNFLAYTHIYGEFGVKLALAKNPQYLSPKMLI